MSDYKTYAVPEHIHEHAETRAMQRRKKGEDVKWSTIIREVLEEWFDKDKSKT